MDAILELEHVIGVNLCSGALHYHPDAQNCVYAIGALVVVADLNDAHRQQILRGHTATISALALSKTGNLIASAQEGEDPDVLVWDYRTQQSIFRLEEYDTSVMAMSFSHDDCLLVTLGGLDDNKLVVWDMSNGYIVAILPRLPQPTGCISFAGFVRDIKRRDTTNYQLVSAGNSNIVFWHLDPYAGTLQHERVSCQSRGMVVRDTVSLNISDDKETVYCAARSGDFVIVNVKQRQVSGTITASRLGVQQVLSWPDGLVVGGGDGCLKVYDQHYRFIKETMLDSAVHFMSLSPDKLEMIAVTQSGTLYRINLETMGFMVLSENPSAAVRKIGISREVDDKFVTVSADFRVRLWDATEYMVLMNVTATNAGQPLCCVYGAELILSGWEDGCVRTFDEDGRPLWSIQPCHQGPVTAMALPTNYRFILTAGDDGAVRLWEIRTRELISHLKEHGQIVNDLLLFGNDTHALSCSRDRSLLCWDLRKEKRLTSHTQRMGGMNGVALSKDETQVITVGQEKKVTFWDLRTPEPVHQTWAAPDAEVTEHPSNEAKCVTTSPDGMFFATGSRDGRIRLWEMRSCRMIFSTEAHSNMCNDLHFTPNNRQLISVGEDGSIFVWNLYANT